jgi:hypothetical protein
MGWNELPNRERLWVWLIEELEFVEAGGPFIPTYRVKAF